MKRLAVILSSVAFLAACSDGGNNQNDPIDNTPAGDTATVPTDQDPTPQTGTGGASPVDSQTGTEKR